MQPSRHRRGLLSAAALVLLASASSACTTSGLAFRVDQRLEFVEPGYREQVTLPVTVDWTMDPSFALTGIDGSSSPTAGLFAVLVDIGAPPPGEGLDYYARDDLDCQRDPACPDANWFRQRGIHATTETSFVIERLQRQAGDNRDRDFHEVTIVLLDGRGRRIGEASWTQVFELVDPDG